ncbi:MAG: ComF family protein [Pelotomaculum sp.]|nr:ComF family protein [Pelotomaculum sp.]
MFTLWNDLLNLIFPPAPECPFCGRPGPPGKACGNCLAYLEGFRREAHCSRCGRLPGKGAALFERGGTRLCGECRAREWPFALVRAAGPYEGIIKEAIHRFKYAGRRGLAAPLAALMAEAARAEPLLAADLILPVPLAGEKLQKRGFNQAALLAGEVGALLRVPVDRRILVKIVETPSQAGLTRPARQTNLEGAFKVINAGKVCGRKVLVVDDVFTTGSTMSAAAAALTAAGAARVSGLTVAAARFF